MQWGLFGDCWARDSWVSPLVLVEPGWGRIYWRHSDLTTGEAVWNQSQHRVLWVTTKRATLWDGDTVRLNCRVPSGAGPSPVLDIPFFLKLVFFWVFYHFPKMKPHQSNRVTIPVQSLFPWWLGTSNLPYVTIAFITWIKSYTKIIYRIGLFLCVWRLTKVVIIKCLTIVNGSIDISYYYHKK